MLRSMSDMKSHIEFPADFNKEICDITERRHSISEFTNYTDDDCKKKIRSCKIKKRFSPYPTADIDGNGIENFLRTGRTGRRNAIHNIDSNLPTSSTGNLPSQLAKLKCSDEDSAEMTIKSNSNS